MIDKDMFDGDGLIIIGAGFAGVWAAAAAAAARHDAGVAHRDLPITLISPGADLIIRPRLYQSEPHRMRISLDGVLGPIGVDHVAAGVTAIDPGDHRVTLTQTRGGSASLGYARLVLASGSRTATPVLPGADHLHDVDTIDAATRLETHLRRLAMAADTPGRTTVVVVGAGFAGIEVATELTSRMAAILPSGQRARVVLVEAREVVGPELGPGPRQVITDALDELGIEVLLGHRLAEVTARGVVFADGTTLDAATVIWTAGMVASPLTNLVPGPRDRLGRLVVDRYLRIGAAPAIYAAGDVAAARCPDGHTVLQSCQHAIPLGKFAGHNAVADLLGLPRQAFDPGPYITCLDLGPAGAVLTTGWDREVRLTGEPAKALKKAIVESYIYPPAGDAPAVLAFARAREHPPLPL